MPETIALMLENNTLPEEYLINSPYIKAHKNLLGGYVIVYVDEDDLIKIENDVEGYAPDAFLPVMGLLGQSDLSAAGITQVHRQPFLNLGGQGVLVGLIDTGIDYTLDAFRYEDGSSRIAYLWDQSIEGTPPSGFNFGTEYEQSAINDALTLPDPRQAVPHVDTVGHGTFLASVAASRERGEYIGAAPDCELVVVKMRKASNYDLHRFVIPPTQENAFSGTDFVLGVQYVVEKAQALGRPAAICISVGSNKGSHNGLSRFESYLGRVSGTIGTCVCAAAGNEAQAGHHTRERVSATGQTKDVELRVSGPNEDIYMNMWNSAADRLSVSLKSPTGELIVRMPARVGVSYTQRLILERSTVVVDYLFPVQRTGEQLTRIKLFSATPGIWTITVHGDSVLDGSFHIWLPLTGFVDPGTVFLTPTPYYTIVNPATSTGVITCGAFDGALGSLAPTSSWGPTRMPALKPDLCAPGVNVGGIFPGGGRGAMSGTSASAAITTGAAALMLQWAIVEGNDSSMDSYRIRSNFIAGCDRDPDISFPNNQWGYGKLDLYSTFRSLRPY